MKKQLQDKAVDQKFRKRVIDIAYGIARDTASSILGDTEEQKWSPRLGADILLSECEEHYRQAIEEAFNKGVEEERNENRALVRAFIYDLFGDKTAVNGIVEVTSHDINYLGNELLANLSDSRHGNKRKSKLSQLKDNK